MDNIPDAGRVAPQKYLINCELFSSLGESQVQFPSEFQKSNTFCQRGLKCHLNFDSGSQETRACTEYREGIQSKSFLLKKKMEYHRGKIKLPYLL